MNYESELALKTLAELESRPFADMEFVDNGWFGFIDSAVYYSMIKIHRPQKIIEVGSGFSTHIARQAFDGELVCIDPEPRKDVKGIADLMIEKPVQDVPVEVIKADMLFIDSSHVWEYGDLPFLYNEVFPRFTGLIHSHDIFLPDDYSKNFAARGYNEQYHLLELLKSGGHEIVYPSYYMATRRKEDVMRIFGTAASTGSFWIC